jgi:Transketolase, thiamine diphosphate binding domain
MLAGAWEGTTAMTVGTRPDVDLDTQPIDQLAVTTIRVLAMDAVQAANSGHPGTPMALAPVGYTGTGIATSVGMAVAGL